MREKSKKRGCIVTGLLVILGIAVVVAASIYVTYLYSNNKKIDEKYVTLMTKEYQIDDFASVVTNANRFEFYKKVRNSARSSQELLLENTYFAQNLTLNEVDLAVFYNSVLNSKISYLNKFDTLFSVLDCQSLKITQTQNEIQYKAYFKVKTESFSNLAQSLYFKDMQDFYLTMSASINFISSIPVKSFELQVNKLTGDDNTYCVNKILTAFGIKVDEANQMGYVPFLFNKTQNEVWGTKFDYQNGNLVIFKNI